MGGAESGEGAHTSPESIDFFVDLISVIIVT